MKKKIKNKAAASLGRLGGKAILRKRGKSYMSKLGKLSGKARRAKSKK